MRKSFTIGGALLALAAFASTADARMMGGAGGMGMSMTHGAPISDGGGPAIRQRRRRRVPPRPAAMARRKIRTTHTATTVITPAGSTRMATTIPAPMSVAARLHWSMICCCAAIAISACWIFPMPRSVSRGVDWATRRLP